MMLDAGRRGALQIDIEGAVMKMDKGDREGSVVYVLGGFTAKLHHVITISLGIAAPAFHLDLLHLTRRKRPIVTALHFGSRSP